MRHFPVLRAGKAYRSAARHQVRHFVTGEILGEMSMANAGLIARDLRDAPRWAATLGEMSIRELSSIFDRAAVLFEEEALAIGDWEQSFSDYLHNLSATTGMPMSLCRKNAQKVVIAMKEIVPTLKGLMRGLEPEILDKSAVETEQGFLSFRRESTSLGAILPSNSPGVHSLWLPAIALKTPVVLKPGRQEPWSPHRIAAALLAAGLPEQAISLYPTDHNGAREILLGCGRSMLFGDERTVAPWKFDHRVQIHGPGWSKWLIGEDLVDRFSDYLNVMVSSICENSGRSCLNVSSVWVPRRGREVAESLAERMAGIHALPLDHPKAALSAFAQPQIAHAISAMVDNLLQTPGAVDLTAKHRPNGRVAEVDGAAFLLPTLIWCERSDHPLMQMEFLFPFAAVAEVPSDLVVDEMQETLVLTALTQDETLINKLMNAPHIDRLNIGAIPTFHIRRDQPHEGNLFEFIYRQRAFQVAGLEA